MSDDFISLSIKKILESGIKLFLDSPEEEEHYIMKLFEYFEVETEFTPYLRSPNSLEIEGSDMQLLVEIVVTESTLFFIPYTSDMFNVFTEVLKFIANHHETTLREFRGIEEIKIQSIKDVNKIDEETEKNTKEEESSSDDDYEWI